jgi:hypothetical protein
MHLVGYLYEDYHDAWSLEHKVYSVCHTFILCMVLSDIFFKESC